MGLKGTVFELIIYVMYDKMYSALTSLDVLVLIVGCFMITPCHKSEMSTKYFDLAQIKTGLSQVCGQLLSVNILSDADLQILPQAEDRQRRGEEWDSKKVIILLRHGHC